MLVLVLVLVGIFLAPLLSSGPVPPSDLVPFYEYITFFILTLACCPDSRARRNTTTKKKSPPCCCVPAYREDCQKYLPTGPSSFDACCLYKYYSGVPAPPPVLSESQPLLKPPKTRQATGYRRLPPVGLIIDSVRPGTPLPLSESRDLDAASSRTRTSLSQLHLPPPRRTLTNTATTGDSTAP